MVVRVSGRDDVAQQLRQLSTWAAVAIAIIDHEADVPDRLSEIAPNVLLADAIPTQIPLDPRPWAKLVAREVVAAEPFASDIQSCQLPVLAVRRTCGIEDVAQARAACDQLQRNLAPYVEVAGFLIVS